MTTRPKPSIDDEVAARLRGMALGMLRKQHGEDVTTWPAEARARYEELTRHQAEYETMYGGEQG